MHELSLMEAVRDQALAAAHADGAIRITVISLRVGELAGVEVEALRFAFPVAMAGTIAAGAELRHVVKMNTYVRDLTSSRVKAFREIRGRHFGEHKPASTLVGTPALVHEDLMIEVEVVAVVD